MGPSSGGPSSRSPYDVQRGAGLLVGCIYRIVSRIAGEWTGCCLYFYFSFHKIPTQKPENPCHKYLRRKGFIPEDARDWFDRLVFPAKFACRDRDKFCIVYPNCLINIYLFSINISINNINIHM